MDNSERTIPSGGASRPPRAPRARRASTALGAAAAPRVASTREYAQRGEPSTRWGWQLVDDIVASARRACAAHVSRRAAVSSPGTRATNNQPSATSDISCMYIYLTYIKFAQITVRGISSNSPHCSSVCRRVRALGRAGEFGRKCALRIAAEASPSLLSRYPRMMLSPDTLSRARNTRMRAILCCL